MSGELNGSDGVRGLPDSGARAVGYADVTSGGIRGRVTFHIGPSEAWFKALGDLRLARAAGSPIYSCEAWGRKIREVASKATPRVSREAGGRWGESGFRVEFWACDDGGAIVRIIPKNHESKSDSAVLQVPISLARAKACGRCKGCSAAGRA